MMQAIFEGRSETSKLSTLRAPLSPTSKRRQLVSTPQPSGVTIPSPVITTRLISGLSGRGSPAAKPPGGGARQMHRVETYSTAAGRMECRRCCSTQTAGETPAGAACPADDKREDTWLRSALRVLLEKLHGIADRENRFGGIVGNLAAEFLFECHHQLNRVETVRTEVVDKTGILGHLLGLDPQMLHDDLLHPIGNVTHWLNLCVSEWAGSWIDFQSMIPEPWRGGLVVVDAVAAFRDWPIAWI